MKGRLSAAVLLTVLPLAWHSPSAQAIPAGSLTRPARLASQPVDAASAQSARDSGSQPSDALSALQAHLESLLNDPVTAAGTWGVDVRSLRTGETLYATNAHRLLTPASTLKSVTLAVAADRLGWDFTYETRVVPVGDIRDGVLHGDLLVIGSGDPSLDDWDGTASGVFREWAGRLKELGVHAITGRIVGDDHVFGDEGFGSGWMWDDMAYDYSAPASGLQFNEGTAQLVIRPGPAVDAGASLMISPAYASVPLLGEITTVAAGTPASISMQQFGRSALVQLTGTVAAGAPPIVRNVAVPNPTLYYVRAVRAGLIANGIDVRGDAVDADDLVGPPHADPAAAALIHRSPPLTDLGGTMMKLSQNLFAESFLRTLGVVSSGTGTADAGLAVVSEVLTSWGIPESEVLMADGSGLSRYNLVTANAMVTMLAHVHADDRLRDAYLDTLPVAGRAGTLASRLRGTRAEGNVQAKTGSFTNARSIAGFLRSADGEPIVFAILANNYGVASSEIDRVSNAVLLALTAFQRPPA